MHNDPTWAEEVGPWPTTIAHGFYLLSLASYFHGQAGFPIVATDDEHVINYGVNRVRFTDPVRIGDGVIASLKVRDITERGSGRSLVTTELTYTTARGGEAKPHMLAETLTLCVDAKTQRAGA
jgi:acyl dehydratase